MIALDLSRLISRAGSATPSGIDRVELAYARHLISGDVGHCFAARGALGQIGRLPSDTAREFVARLATLWRAGASGDERRRVVSLARRLRLAALAGGRALRAAFRQGGAAPVYLLVSHQNLDRPGPFACLKSATGARFVCLIHDLIPLDFPHLTRPAQIVRHGRRIAAVAALADAVVVNSAATGDRLRERLGGHDIPVCIAPLGAELPQVAATVIVDGSPYFVCVGTIEARKNHLLLLEVWRRLVAELGAQVPRLMLIGQRGFGADEVLRRLGDLRDVVIERPDMPDAAMAALLRGARGLLLPSLAEGFGLPVAEALALGVPVLCSGLPALHESGGGVPEYLDPRAAAWHDAVLDFLADSPRRRAQLERLARWRAPTWPAHFAIVEQLIARL